MTFEHRTVDAMVQLASKNGVSLMLSFQAMLGGYVSAIPVIFQDGDFRDLIQRRPVGITPQVPE